MMLQTTTAVVLILATTFTLAKMTGGTGRERGSAARTSGECAAITKQMSSLTPAERDLLRAYGFITTEHQRQLLIGPSLVPDCKTRMRFGRFILATVDGGETSAPDKEFIRRHSGLYGMLIRHIWRSIANSPAMPSDGAMQFEKWNLLKELSDSDLTVILTAEIIAGGLDANSAEFINDRHLTPLIPYVQKIMTDNSSKVSDKLYAIAILGHEANINFRPIVTKLGKRHDLTPAQRETIEKLEGRLQKNQKVEWSDVGALVEDEI